MQEVAPLYVHLVVKMHSAHMIQDLISYIFESTEPLVVKECVKGDGKI